MMFTVFLQDMLINDKKFHGSNSFVENHTTLRTVAGNSSWLTEFKPVRFPAIRIFHQLLFLFHSHDFCSFMTESFVAFIAGIINYFRGVTFFMVLDDHPILKLIFQKYHVEIQILSLLLFILNS